MMLESITIKAQVESFVEKISNNADHLKRHRPYGGLAIILLAALLTGQCDRTRFVHALEMANLDAWLVSQKTQISPDIALVGINDKDYEDSFKRNSPLDRGEVKNLIVKIAKAGARVIVVDVDTSDWTREDMPSLWLRQRLAPAQPPIVVWARTTHQAEGGPLFLYNVAGRDDTVPIQSGDETVCWGVPEVLENGGFVRAYSRNVSLGATTVPSLAGAAANAFQDPHPHYDRTGSINCDILSRKSEGASAAVLKTGSQSFPRYNAALLKEFNGTPLSGKIVILGGTFAEARDSYWTALGPKDGIEILATAVDSELHTPSPLKAPEVVYYALDIVVGLLILLSARLLPRLISLLFVVAAIPIAAFVGSLVAFWFGLYYVSFIPVLLGVFFHKLVDDVYEAYKARGKNALLRGELEEIIYNEEILSERKTLTTRITRGSA